MNAKTLLILQVLLKCPLQKTKIFCKGKLEMEILNCHQEVKLINKRKLLT